MLASQPGCANAALPLPVCKGVNPTRTLAVGCMAAASPTACSATGLAWQPGRADEAQEGAGRLQGANAQEQALVGHIYLCAINLP